MQTYFSHQLGFESVTVNQSSIKMESTSVNCVSVFFNTDLDDEICQKHENCMMLEDEYDESLYQECTLLEAKLK